jgi:large subunit ribosomal protein L18
MLDKKLKRQRRAAKSRAKIRTLGIARLCVGRSAKHLYAQVIASAEKGDKVLASASTLDKEVRTRLVNEKTEGSEAASAVTFNNVRCATVLGVLIGQRALAAGINRVAFDRSGFKYHGCVKALAEAARETGLLF